MCRTGFTPFKHSSNNYCCNSHMKGNRLPCVIIFVIDAAMPLGHYAYTGAYKWPFHLNSQDFYVPLANRCPENTQPVSTF